MMDKIRFTLGFNEDAYGDIILPEAWEEFFNRDVASKIASGEYVFAPAYMRDGETVTIKEISVVPAEMAKPKTQEDAVFSFTKPSMLFVDDRTKRIHYAIDVLMPKYDVTIAANVPEALRLLCSRDWDYVSLDHDLDGFDMNDPDRKDTGMEIVRYIEKTGWPPNRHPPTFIIHSSNALAAHLMDVSLQELNFQTMQVRINYTTDHMEYDEDGNPQ